MDHSVVPVQSVPRSPALSPKYRLGSRGVAEIAMVSLQVS